MNVYNKFKSQIEDVETKTIEVSSREFKEILEDSSTVFGPLKPQPPISKVVDKAKFQKIRVGLFRWEMQKIHEHKEYHYDYHDKDYLEQMAAYKSQEKNVNELYFHGKRVILKDKVNDDFKI